MVRTTHSAAMRRSLSFNRFPDQRGRVGSVELVDRDDAGGRSDVDLGQIARDHVDPHENQTAPCEFRADGGANRSEEHTSELQPLMRITYAVFCLKKKKKK